jgi:hypothetical protein
LVPLLQNATYTDLQITSIPFLYPNSLFLFTHFNMYLFGWKPLFRILDVLPPITNLLISRTVQKNPYLGSSIGA